MRWRFVTPQIELHGHKCTQAELLSVSLCFSPLPHVHIYATCRFFALILNVIINRIKKNAQLEDAAPFRSGIFSPPSFLFNFFLPFLPFTFFPPFLCCCCCSERESERERAREREKEREREKAKPHKVIHSGVTPCILIYRSKMAAVL